MIILISGIFMEAWQLSAVTEDRENYQENFFTKVFDAYNAIIFLAASLLIPFSKLITSVLVSKAFYDSWRYIPFLVMSTVFSCLVTFLGTIYMVKKRSVMSLITAMAAAGINIILNLVLIPVYGANGAAFATFISYFAVFVIRAINTRTMIKISWNPLKQALNIIILLLQCVIMISEVKYWPVFEVILGAILFSANMKMVVLNAKKIFK
jgi:O-antigen/teichoic acid export membrane protein